MHVYEVATSYNLTVPYHATSLLPCPRDLASGCGTSRNCEQLFVMPQTCLRCTVSLAQLVSLLDSLFSITALVETDTAFPRAKRLLASTGN